MFDLNYNPETSLKNWARALRVAGICFTALSFLAALIVLIIDAEYLWWLSLVILGGGGLVLAAIWVSTAMLWAFGDMVGNTKRMACGSAHPVVKNNDVLPEL